MEKNNQEVKADAGVGCEEMEEMTAAEAAAGPETVTVEELTPAELIETLEAEVALLRQQYARSMADYANLKQRTERQRRELLASANSVLVCKMLPVIDNFERALATIEAPEVKAGVDMIYRQLTDLLAAEGLEKIEAENQPFDPYIHEALFQEQNDTVEDNTVLQVFEPGYRFKNKLLRAAKVKVSTL